MAPVIAAVSQAGAAIGTAASSMTAAQGLGLAASGASSISQMMGTRSQAKGLAAQATMARLQAKSESLKYKAQGVQVLDNILRTQAAIVARAANGGIDPFSGSANSLMQYASAKGATELYTVQDNELITMRGGEMQAQQYMQQAKSVMKAGMIGGIAKFGTAAVNYGLIGGLEPSMGYGVGQVDPRLFKAAGLG